MKILVVAEYPYSGHQFGGHFNQRCVIALKEYCDRIEVMAHRQYLPRWVSSLPVIPRRWRMYAAMANFEIRDGISIHRPGFLRLPWIGYPYWIDRGAFFWCRRTVRELHRRVGFDAMLSFDLFGTGGVAWRLGRDLGIPASGWATGGDMRQPPGTRLERIVAQAIKRLDLVFYQSRELFEIAARILGIHPEMMLKEKHLVLSRGIPEPPSLPKTETRNRVRSALGIIDNEILVLSVGGIVREKGVFELLEAISLAAARDARIRCVLLGSRPVFDETSSVQKLLDRTPILKDRVKLLPACVPDKVWEYLCAADIFAFPSYEEGMPNSLLEAMAMGLPAVAFAIPAALEIEAGTGSPVLVPPLDSALFAQAILHLAASPDERITIANRGRTQVLQRFMVRKNMAEAVRWLAQVVEKRNSARSARHQIPAKSLSAVSDIHSG
jgi:glycosyltransferase involved in cell wall biosynthesis